MHRREFAKQQTAADRRAQREAEGARLTAPADLLNAIRYAAAAIQRDECDARALLVADRALERAERAFEAALHGELESGELIEELRHALKSLARWGWRL